ncbi:hypothetical protein A3B35_02960 [Candidatus Kaiserbacteria bacterium RIFCSPLOWO2_01_FULL_54_24]|uniref:Uncharacterized protein n=1 Tax=Candidatus Kaiserbacteria bacterium RIFCSPLOWO2_01_FULL_54_24 TaxID=1798515 RepID=A0A1F6ET30_9BACT|nr:MAG: hypothetical protein A3B35_02960 [Candidatus Kaiserbacteria bacterium RIFCSPLOWO2_01_FULL_54_24]
MKGSETPEARRDNFGSDVRNLLPGLVKNVQQIIESNESFSPDIKQRLFVALNVTEDEVISNIIENSTRYSYLKDSEKKIKYFLIYRLMGETIHVLQTVSSTAEKNAFLKLLTYLKPVLTEEEKAGSQAWAEKRKKLD